MAKREISSTLRNLKFMQRSALKEEKKKKKIDDDDDDDNANFTPSPGSVSKKCVVITDWDPQPRALLGRLSFQSFNPSIEKLNEEESITGGKTDASPTGSSGNGGRMSFSEPKVETSQETNGDLKRKQSLRRGSLRNKNIQASPLGAVTNHHRATKKATVSRNPRAGNQNLKPNSSLTSIILVQMCYSRSFIALSVTSFTCCSNTFDRL